jgi:hypothetical protein
MLIGQSDRGALLWVEVLQERQVGGNFWEHRPL